jgi:hypothetical protein
MDYSLYFIGIIYEGIIIIIATPILIKSLINYLKVRNSFALILFLILLNFSISIFFSWFAKIISFYWRINYIEDANVPDPKTPISWILLRISHFRFSYIFITIAIYLSDIFRMKIFEIEHNHFHIVIVRIFTIFNIFFAIIFFDKNNNLYDMLVFLFVFIFMNIVFIPFMKQSIKSYESTEISQFKKAFLSLVIMSISYIAVLLCLLIDRIYIFFGHFGFTIFYFLSWIFVIFGILGNYFGYLRYVKQ